jgi:hypothetical protein
VIHYRPVILPGYAIDLHRRGFINQIEQCRKGIAKADTTPASVTYIKNTFKLVKH